MKLFKKEVVVEPEVIKETAKIGVPVAALMTIKTLEADAIKEYETVATTIGFAPSKLLEEKLKRYLLDNAIHVYDRTKVESFLTQAFTGKQWGWRPLRKKDLDANLQFTHLRTNENGRILDRTYNAAIPLPVLLTVKDLDANVTGLSFFVSDEADSATGDPFLMVTALGCKPFIIERWDEPSFRE